MSVIDNKFFELLRAGLWQVLPKSCADLTEKDWEEIYDISEKQSLVGIITDGIEQATAHRKEEVNELHC